MYESVYSAEAKAAEIGLKATLKIKDMVFTLYGPLELVMYTDNKALCMSLLNDSEIHPFASTFIDFLRQTITDLKMKVGWVPTMENLADILTKPSKL